MKFNLGWGYSVAVRKAFVENIGNFNCTFTNQDVLDMDYHAHDGEPTMIEETRKVIERQTGIRYEHIVLTNGATGALNVALTALKNATCFESVITPPAPFFRMYPDIIKNASFEHIQEELSNKIYWSTIILIDSPSNPTGKIYNGALNLHTGTNKKIIWDSVYHTKSYLPKGHFAAPTHDLNVGSYSKMTGANGIRIGWIATNDSLLFPRIQEAVAPSYCGLSAAQNKVTLELLKRVDWDSFEKKAKQNLDANREEWSKLEKYFGDTPVYDVGMFYYAPMDAACKRLLDNAGASYFLGSQLGHNDDHGRINVGQDMDIVKNAVKAILAEDKI